uniref:ARAD1D42878p n=1 Tax=Blastobotrys adeninivorans TaxID=409370 RepID=A0A060TCX0_BLAAD
MLLFTFAPLIALASAAPMDLDDILSECSIVKFINGTAGLVDLGGSVLYWAKPEYVDHLAPFKSYTDEEFIQLNLRRQELANNPPSLEARAATCAPCSGSSSCGNPINGCLACVGGECAVAKRATKRDLCEHFYC